MASTSANAGGLVGGTNSDNVINSYWCTETSGKATSSGGTGYTSLEMLDKSKYIDWDFDTIWNIQDGVSLPTLRDMP